VSTTPVTIATVVADWAAVQAALLGCVQAGAALTAAEATLSADLAALAAQGGTPPPPPPGPVPPGPVPPGPVPPAARHA
jgi:hypothetical protein